MSPYFGLLASHFETAGEAGRARLYAFCEAKRAVELHADNDNLTWTFILREGVKFHNGRPLMAQDIVHSCERIMDPDTGSGVAWRFERRGDQRSHGRHPSD
ncbi:MAG: ABC transporter substrate-binding protein [Anaerolineae bacterium]